MIKELTAEQSEIIANNNGLSRYLKSLRDGRHMTPRSGLYEHLEPNQILQRGEDVLNTLESNSKYEDMVFQFEQRSKAKGGPQGGVEPLDNLLKDLVLPTFDAASPPAAFSTEAWIASREFGTHILSHLIGNKRLRPASYKSVVDDMRARDTLVSNSGWPLFQRRNRDEVIKASIEDAKTGKGVDYPAILLFRNYNNKTRPVGMYPLSTNIVEGSYIEPLFRALVHQDIDFFAPGIGFDRVRNLIGDEFKKDKFLTASDFSATDEHFTIHSTNEVFKLIAPLYQESALPGLKESMEKVNKIPLLIGENKIIYGNHGVSSGSRGTNFVETLFDFIFSLYVNVSTENTTNGVFAIGDDMLGESTRYSNKLADKLEYFGKQVGQVVKADKTTNERDWVVSLQRLFQRGYNTKDSAGHEIIRAVYPTIRALKSAVYPEKFHNPKLGSSDMFCARIYMILENCVDHPLFEEFVKFVVKGNSHLIPFAKLSRDKLNKITLETKSLPAFNPTYNQERRDSSLAEFASIKIAAKL